MANSYSGDVFLIDTPVNRAGLVTLKGGAPDTDDLIYVFSGATVTLSSDADFKQMFVGRDDGGLSSTGYVDVLAGASVKFKGGSGNGLYVDSLGQFVLNGTSGSRCGIDRAAGETDVWELGQMDGIFQATQAQIQNLDIVASISGYFEANQSTMDVLFSATSELINSGTMALVSSVITSGNRWALKNYGEVTLDELSALENAKICITCSSQSLIFDDDPDEIDEDNSPFIAKSVPLGGTKARGKRLGQGGRRLLLKGSFDIDKLYTHYLLLKKLINLNDTFKVTWDEGSLNNALLGNFPIIRTPDQVGERYYSLEIQEIY